MNSSTGNSHPTLRDGTVKGTDEEKHMPVPSSHTGMKVNRDRDLPSSN